MSELKTKAGLVGCGMISKAHINAIKDANLDIAALCDIDKARAEQVKAELCTPQTTVYTSHHDMLKHDGLAIVGIATPPYLHKEQIIDVLRAGMYVYCEKPVADTLNGITEILEAEKSTGRRALYTPSRRRSGTGMMIKQYIDNGDMGEVYRVDMCHFRERGRPGVDQNLDSRWFADSKKAITGISGDMGFYFFDQALYLTGWPRITSVSATTYREFPFEMPEGAVYDVEEHIVIFARTAGKLTFTFELANICHHPWTNSVRIFGTGGGILVDDEKKFRYRTEKGAPWHTITHTGNWNDENGDIKAYKALAEYVSGRSCDNATTTQQVFALHELLQMAFLSAKVRREIGPGDINHAYHIMWNEKR